MWNCGQVILFAAACSGRSAVAQRIYTSYACHRGQTLYRLYLDPSAFRLPQILWLTSARNQNPIRPPGRFWLARCWDYPLLWRYQGRLATFLNGPRNPAMPALPSIDTLSAIKLKTDETGDEFSASDLWKDGPAVVVVLRRPGCGVFRVVWVLAGQLWCWWDCVSA